MGDSLAVGVGDAHHVVAKVDTGHGKEDHHTREQDDIECHTTAAQSVGGGALCINTTYMEEIQC